MPSWIVRVALRQLSFHWRQTVVSVLGITASVLVLLVILSFSQGINQFFGERILRLSPHLTLEAGINDYVTTDLQGLIEDLDGVVGAAPYITFPGIIQKGLSSETVVFKGVNWEKEDELHSLSALLDKGDWTKITSEPGVVIGAELARLLGAGIDDVVKVVSPQASTYLEVNGLFYTGFYGNDAQLVLLPLEVAQRLVDEEGLTGYGVRLENGDLVDEYIFPLQERTNLWVRPWYEKEQGLFVSMEVQRLIMVWITGFSLLVATLGIMNVFLLRAWSQQRNAGILRTVGATPFQVGLVFLCQGFLCGFLGGLSGLICARLVVSWLSRFRVHLPQVFYIDTLPVAWAYNDVWWVLSVSVLAGLLAVVYPSWRLSTLAPYEVMRNE